MKYIFTFWRFSFFFFNCFICHRFQTWIYFISYFVLQMDYYFLLKRLDFTHFSDCVVSHTNQWHYTCFHWNYWIFCFKMYLGLIRNYIIKKCNWYCSSSFRLLNSSAALFHTTHEVELLARFFVVVVVAYSTWCWLTLKLELLHWLSYFLRSRSNMDWTGSDEANCLSGSLKRSEERPRP